MAAGSVTFLLSGDDIFDSPRGDWEAESVPHRLRRCRAWTVVRDHGIEPAQRLRAVPRPSPVGRSRWSRDEFACTSEDVRAAGDEARRRPTPHEYPMTDLPTSAPDAA